MAKTTVDAAIQAGLAKAGGVHAAGDLGMRVSGRSVLGGTGKSITGAVSRRSTMEQSRPGAKLIWKGDQVLDKIGKNMKVRLRIASQVVKDQTKRNLSIPVLKYKGIRSGRMQVLPESRSKEGEFPRADTTRLKKDIFNEVISETRAVVGTTLDYGLILETEMDRSFLRRTLREMEPLVRRILTKGM